MTRYEEDTRLRGERRRQAIDDLRDELKQDKSALMESARTYLKKGVISDRRFRDITLRAVDDYTNTGRISDGQLDAIAGIVAFIEIEEDA
jgi:hypothetical protein